MLNKNIQLKVTMFGCGACCTITLGELIVLAHRAGETGVSLELEIHGVIANPPQAVQRVLSLVPVEPVVGANGMESTIAVRRAA